MSGSCIADRLGDLITLSPAEQEALERLEQRERSLRKGAVLLRENDPLSDLYVLKRGMMMSFVLLSDGRRQILRFFYPGDLMAMPALVYRRSPEAVCALADSVVAPFERAAMADLVADHSRLAAILMAMVEMERVALTDRLAGIGRTSAKARVAALLLDLRDRMRATDPAIAGSFTPRLTQEEIGDATGLTAVHVNRMLRTLEVEGLIARSNGRVTFVNEPALRRAANYADRLNTIDLSWLPGAR